MATVTARKVDDRDYVTFQEVAEENGRSVSEELRILIAGSAKKRRAERAVTDFLDFTRRNPVTLPKGMTSLDLLREERDSW